MTHGRFTFSLALASTLLVVIIFCNCTEKKNLPVVPSQDQLLQPQKIEQHPSIDIRDLQEENNGQLMVALTEKLKVQNLQMNGSSLVPHQFVHLHNMKTGGTSMDGMMKCAMERMRDDLGVEIPYYNLHECQRGKYRRCKAGEEPKCNAVWSMFRFEPKECYTCKSLKEVYSMIDANETEPLDSLCLRQLQNKETENLLTSWQTAQWNGATEEEMVEEATSSMKGFFTLIGLTSELETTHAMVGRVFPWLNETVAGSDTACPMPHKNISPKNNHCGPDFTHWDLPDHPDEETRKLIEEHNQMDLKLYAAAVEHFELQKQALGLAEDDM